MWKTLNLLYLLAPCSSPTFPSLANLPSTLAIKALLFTYQNLLWHLRPPMATFLSLEIKIWLVKVAQFMLDQEVPLHLLPRLVISSLAITWRTMEEVSMKIRPLFSTWTRPLNNFASLEIRHFLLVALLYYLILRFLFWDLQAQWF